MDLKFNFNKKNFHYIHRYAMYYASRFIRSIREAIKKIATKVHFFRVPSCNFVAKKNDNQEDNMRKIIFFIIVILLCCLTAAAYECFTKDHSIPVQKDAAVDIELEGEIILNSWDFSRMDLKVETVITGKVWGIEGNRSSRRKYDVIIQKNGPGVVITGLPKPFTFTIGISTLEVKHRHFITVPGDAKISIRSTEGNIVAQGSFRMLDLESKKGKCKVKLSKEQIKFLDCSSPQGEIVVNGTRKDPHFKMSGSGSDICTVTTKEGKIDISLY